MIDCEFVEAHSGNIIKSHFTNPPSVGEELVFANPSEEFVEGSNPKVWKTLSVQKNIWEHKGEVWQCATVEVACVGTIGDI